jgi:ABC-type branched-subunit amino acid transport system substrate-binding protein
MNHRYRWWLLPRRDRFPKKLWHWWRLTLAAVLVAGTVVGIPWLGRHWPCADGPLPSAALWSEDGDCVGVTSGPYAFKLDQFGRAMAQIDRQNRSAGNLCPKGASAITVGVLSTLTSPYAGGRAAHEIEGIAAAQARANGAGCVHPVLVKLANMGTNEQAAIEVAEMVKDDSQIVAVVGVGLSDPNSADAANLLGSSPEPVPMVSDLITAEGFDANGSRGKDADFRNCAATYPTGVGGGYFYRVAYPNRAQITKLAGYLGAVQPDFVVTPTDLRDPYTCTALPLVEHRFNDQVTRVKFDPTDLATVPQVARRICGTAQAVNVFYTARSKDLSRFIQSVDDQYSRGLCQSSSITVLSTSDASRLRAREPENGDELVRVGALNSRIVQNGILKLIYTPLADSDSLRTNSEFIALEQQFTAAGFDLSDLDDGWAVNAYDALLTVVEETRTLSASQPVTRGEINSGLSALSPGNEMAGAGGKIAFDSYGNRTGDPTMVRLCPATHDTAPFTVPVSADASNSCTS